jgi:preprotein translocase subunit YajC
MVNYLFLLEESGGGVMSLLVNLAPFAAIAAIFYFLVIVPQKKQKQQLQDMISTLKINDEIVTNGGVIGKIKEVRETSFIVLSADKSLLEIGKSAVVGRKP